MSRKQKYLPRKNHLRRSSPRRLSAIRRIALGLPRKSSQLSRKNLSLELIRSLANQLQVRQQKQNPQQR